MKKIDLEKYSYKLGGWIAAVVFSCFAACITGVAIALTVWILRALFKI
jgi:hypothetical protein